MDGILLVDKAQHWTSFDVVAKIRGCLRAQTGQKKPKVGHSGTLDPLATGLLILLVGSYCKQAKHFSGMSKTYETVLRLGATSTTADDEGDKTTVSPYQPTEAEIKATVAAFIGDISQIPPAYSAKKVGGQRAYKLARSGQPVALEPQQVTVHGIEVLHYEYPDVSCRMRVSSGTYIRSLAEAIGSVLTTGAYLSALRRTAVGSYSVDEADSVGDICEDVATHLTQPDVDKKI